MTNEPGVKRTATGKFAPKQPAPVAKPDPLPQTPPVPDKPKFKRRPLGNRRSLVFDGMDTDHYVYRVVNDRPGRVEMFKEAGWDPVRGGKMGDENQPGSIISKQVGNGVTGILMRKAKELEEADDQPRIQRAADDEDAIFGEVDRDERYGKIIIGDTVREKPR